MAKRLSGVLPYDRVQNKNRRFDGDGTKVSLKNQIKNDSFVRTVFVFLWLFLILPGSFWLFVCGWQVVVR
jgi:hypothetical protein